MKTIEKNAFISLTREQFITELLKFPFLKDYKSSVPATDDELDEEEFQIYIGDIESDEVLRFNACNLLVVGNIKAKWLDAQYKDDGDEGGSLFVMGAVTCDYFSTYYSKIIAIAGDLKAHRILNNAFEDSALIVKGDLTTEYFYGVDVWADVEGTAYMEYGNGYCLPMGWPETSRETFEPEHSESQSRAFLGLAEEEYLPETINQIIEQRVKS